MEIEGIDLEAGDIDTFTKTIVNTAVGAAVVGGVANNEYLKKCFKDIEGKEVFKFVYPPKFMMNDNAAMIAWATILKYRNNHDLNFRPNPRLTVKKQKF